VLPLDLEGGVKAAQLIVVARVEGVSETTVLQGGQTARVIEQYRLRPLQVLKGTYDRDELLMTGDDLGITRFGESSRRLAVGDVFLVILARQGLNWFVCNPLETLEQSIPRLEGENDGLIEAVKRLVEVTSGLDRARAVEVLLAGLRTAGERDGIPLLRALGRRGLIAAQVPALLEVLGRHLDGTGITQQIESARALRAVLEADYLEQPQLRRGAAARIGAILSRAQDQGEVSLRYPVLEALAAVGPAARDEASTVPWLRIDGDVPTIGEQVLRLRAIGTSDAQAQSEPVGTLYGKLPLDAADELQLTAARALGQIDLARAATAIADRIERKAKAGIGFMPELTAAGELPAKDAATVLLVAFELPMSDPERQALLAAAQRLRGTPEAAPPPPANAAGAELGEADRERLATVLADPQAAQEARLAALACLVAIDDPRLPTALRAAVRDAGIENTELLRQVEAELVRRKISIEPQ
jgi:hypothetical protein